MPRINTRATGIASQAIITSPSETTAPARVPGTDTFPNALSVAGFLLSVLGIVNTQPTQRSAIATETYDMPASLPNPFILLRAAIAPYCFIIWRICMYCLMT